MTLLELLLYTGLISIILAVLYQFFSMSVYARINEVVEDELFVNSRAIIRELNTSIKTANAITLPAMGENGSTLSLSNGQIIYSVSAQQALTKTQDGVESTITDGEALVENITFSQFGPSSSAATVKIVFTLLGRHLQETGERRETFQTAVTLR